MATTFAAAHGAAHVYPVSVRLTPAAGERNRLTAALRPILAIPHLLLAGPAVWVNRFGMAGVLGTAAYLLAIVNWFSILVTGEDRTGIREFQMYYLRWRVRALAYSTLLVDAYPPFGDADYPAGVGVFPPQTRDRVTIAVRPLLAVPHLVILFFLGLAWLLATIAAWVAILLTGAYPRQLEPLTTGCLRWLIRVEAYLLLLVDDYPPFGLD